MVLAGGQHGGPGQSAGVFAAGAHVVGAAADLQQLAGAGVHLADRQMGVGNLFAFHYKAHHHAGDVLAHFDELFHLKAAAEQLLLQLLGGDIDIHIFLQPAEWYFHGFASLNP